MGEALHCPLCDSVRGYSCPCGTAASNSCEGIAITDKTSDGYHTFDELYDHRITLFIALCAEINNRHHNRLPVWRSKLHSDGSAIDGWFVMGIGVDAGKQITYHLPLDRWDEVAHLTITRERAPDFDGHTSADVLSRLRRLYAR